MISRVHCACAIERGHERQDGCDHPDQERGKPNASPESARVLPAHVSDRRKDEIFAPHEMGIERDKHDNIDNRNEKQWQGQDVERQRWQRNTRAVEQALADRNRAPWRGADRAFDPSRSNIEERTAKQHGDGRRQGDGEYDNDGAREDVGRIQKPAGPPFAFGNEWEQVTERRPCSNASERERPNEAKQREQQKSR